MGLLDRLRAHKEHRYCQVCGAEMASFTMMSSIGFDGHTGYRTYDTRVGWACSDMDFSRYNFQYHDGWQDYDSDRWKRLHGSI